MSRLMMGTDEVLRVMMGTEEVTSLFMGSEEISSGGTPEPEPIDYSQIPFTIEVLTDGTITLQKAGILSSSNVPNCSYQYSINGGTAQTMTFETSVVISNTINVSSGDIVTFTVLQNTNGTTGGNSKNALKFTGTAEINVYGNILSLCYPDYQSKNSLPCDYCFYYLFWGDSKLISAENLVLPNTTRTYCYGSMFQNASNLVSGPQLPYSGDVSSYAYSRMFNNCTSLSNTQVLPATGISSSSYNEMYKGASSVSRIECYAVYGINDSNSTKNWVDGVAANGTFVKKSGVTWPSGVNGIPSNWTVVEA